MEETELDVTAIQCWTSMEEYFGVVPCTVMSMMSNGLDASACETDIAGVVGMYALALASGKPSALVDWNNNYGDDPDKARGLPLLQPAEGRLRRHPGHGLPGDHRRHGGQGEHLRHDVWAREGRAVHVLPRLHRRLQRARIAAYVGEGEFTDDPLEHLRRLRRGAACPTCRSCCATSARTASSTTWR